MPAAATLVQAFDILQVEELKQKQQHELKQVQLRVQTAVATKDDTVAALREQLDKTTQQLRFTEAVLQQQQDELCHTA